MEQSKYDVFISYSRKDYVDEQKNVIPDNEVSKIKDALTAAKISYWFDENGIFSGDEFAGVIADAIDASSVFLFVSSGNSNCSDWTIGEVATAQEANKIIIPIRIDTSRYHKSLRVRLNALDYIDFVPNPQKALSEMVDAIRQHLEEIQAEIKRKQEDEKRKKAEEEKKQKLLKEEARKEKINTEIKDLVVEGKYLVESQEHFFKLLVEKNIQINTTDKKCPVCNSSVHISQRYCNRCGWQFPIMYSLYGKDSHECDKKQLVIARTNWKGLGKVKELLYSQSKLENEKSELLVSLDKLMKECKSYIKKIDTQEAVIASNQHDNSLLEQQLKQIQDEYQHLAKSKEETENCLQKEIYLKQGTIRTLEKEIKYEREYSQKVSKENDAKEKELKKLKDDYSEMEKEWLSISERVEKLEKENQSLWDELADNTSKSSSQKDSIQSNVKDDFFMEVTCMNCRKELRLRCHNVNAKSNLKCPHCQYTIKFPTLVESALIQDTLPNGYLLDMKYKIQKVLGIGGFGITYSATSLIDNKSVAIKELFVKGIHQRDSLLRVIDNTKYSQYKRPFIQEANLLRGIKHKSIVSFYQLLVTNNTAYIVMEYINGYSLSEMKSMRKIASKEMLKALKDITTAIKYLHSKGIVHGDIAPQNIMRKSITGDYVLVDFGLSLNLGRTSEDTIILNHNHTTTIIPPKGFREGYSPIEQVYGHQLDSTCDVYAFGATIYYILTNETPPGAYSVLENQNIIKMKLDEVKAYKPLAEIVIGSMKPNKRQRITIDAIIKKLNTIPENWRL